MQRSRGFTLMELIIIMGLLASLFVFSSINLLRPQRSSSLEVTLTQVVADLRHQQLKAMTGENGGGDFGVYFETGSYYLFSGSSYTPGDPANSQVDLESTLQFSAVSVPNPLVFQAGSGDAPPGALVLGHADGSLIHTLNFNHHGVVTQVD